MVLLVKTETTIATSPSLAIEEDGMATLAAVPSTGTKTSEAASPSFTARVKAPEELEEMFPAGLLQRSDRRPRSSSAEMLRSASPLFRGLEVLVSVLLLTAGSEVLAGCGSAVEELAEGGDGKSAGLPVLSSASVVNKRLCLGFGVALVGTLPLVENVP